MTAPRLTLVHYQVVCAVGLLLMGILLDSIFQWAILGSSYPGAAVVVGPILIAAPYLLARALGNRWARLFRSR